MPRPISLIVIHCSASPNGLSLFRKSPEFATAQTPAEVIDEWHAARQFHRAPNARARFNPGLAAIGYHYVLYINGAVATGRHHDEVGAHAEHFNRASIGLCLIGTDRFSVAQWSALTHLVANLRQRYPEARVVGHRDLPNVHKACPGFDVSAWIARDMISDPDHTLES